MGGIRVKRFIVLFSGLLGVHTAIAQLQITTATLPAGTELVPYTTTLAASGGTLPYTWRVPSQHVETGNLSTFAAGGLGQGWQGEDQCWGPITLPFPFPFFGTMQTQCYVNTKTVIRFDQCDTDFTPTLTELGARPMIAALWGDWQTAGSGNGSEDIYISSNAQQITIRWQGELWGGGHGINVSATLWSNGVIELKYGPANDQGGMIGISAGNGTQYVVSARSQSGSMADADDIIFTPATGLPPGLTCTTNGVISGLPTAAGTSQVIVVVQDATAATATRELSLAIAPNANAKPVVTSNAPPAGAVVIGEATSRLFTTWAVDPEGSNLTYRWTLDDLPVGGNSSSHTLETAWGDAGSRTLRCLVSDNLWSNLVFSQWTITILDDNDGDGIPNAEERAFPSVLDPWDPSDADEDPDDDFATNGEEYDAGTSYTDPDSDDDSLPDGWELRYGLNPLDPSGGIPGLDVRERGTTIFTASTYLNYLASPVPGYLYAAGSGFTDMGMTGRLAVVDVSTPSAPVTTSMQDLPGWASEMVALGGWVYVAVHGPLSVSGLLALDATIPGSPLQQGRLAGPYPSGLATGSLYAASGSRLDVISLADPGNPSVQSTTWLSWPNYSYNLIAHGGCLYADTQLNSDWPPQRGLLVYEIDANTNLLQRNTVSLATGESTRFAVWSNHLIAAVNLFGESHIAVFDLADPTNPVAAATFDVDSVNNLFVHSNELYVAGENGLRIYGLNGDFDLPLLFEGDGDWGQDVMGKGNQIWLLRGPDLVAYENLGPIDTDGDGLADSWEVTWFTNLNRNGLADLDGDGITDRGEFRAGLDPQQSDQDDDGLLDGTEVTLYGSRPDRLDTDGDGITDPEEVLGTLGYVTSPYLRDTDGDGSRDDVEYDLQTNPTHADPPGLSVIVGRIRWLDQNLTGAKVSFRGLGNRTYAEGVANALGIYALIVEQAGSYYVKVEMPDYQDQWYPGVNHRDLAMPFVITGISAFGQVDFDLPPGQSPALLDVTSDPSGAAIYLDFQATGSNTPAIVDVGETKPRNLRPDLAPTMVTLRKAGYPRPAQQSIEPVEAETRPLFFDMITSGAGAIKVRTPPPGGGRVYIDASEVLDGYAPITYTNLGAGSHTIHIRKPGYLQPRPVLAWVVAGQTNDIVVNLTTNTEPDLSLQAHSVPPAATIHLDYVPTTNLTDILLHGLDPASYTGPGWHSASHTLSLRRSGYHRSAQRYVDVSTSGVQTVTVLLVPLPGIAADADHDGLPDPWEDAYRLNELAPGQSGAQDDPDHDGSPNKDELNAGTNPLDGNSTFEIPVQSAPNGINFTFRFPTIPGRRYVVQCADSITATWSSISGIITATSPETEYTTTLPPEAQDRFYRVIVLP